MTRLCTLGTAAIVLAGAFAPAWAADGGGDFTFHRVKPPAAGTTKRINISIDRTWPYDYDAPVTARATAPVEVVPAEKALPLDWFWQAVSPQMDAAGPERLDAALDALNAAPDQKAHILPDQSMIERIVADYGAAILTASAGKRVSPALVLAVIAVESGGRPQAASNKGAQGLMQLIPATAERFGVADANDPVQNIQGGVAYLDWLMNEFQGDPLLSLAAYNAGENAVRKNGGVPPYAETRAYVPKVVAAWDRSRLYCLTMPVYADDGCVFAFDRSFLK